MPVKRVDVGVTKSVAEGKGYLKIDEIQKMIINKATLVTTHSRDDFHPNFTCLGWTDSDGFSN